MKFAASYSCGKDSTLAIHKMREQGHEPICLVIMQNKKIGRSYFHGADSSMLERYSKALSLPVILCQADEATYQSAFEAGLKKAKMLGAEAVCFGDIDIEQNRKWEEDCCEEVGLFPCFPLWQRGREDIVFELMRLNYKCLIKSVKLTALPKDILGMFINEASVSIMKSRGIDICGENGEYHTLAVDGPIFQTPLHYVVGDIIELGEHAVIDIR